MRTLVLVADDASTVRRIRLALRYAAGLRLVATLEARHSIGTELARLEPDLVLVADACQRVNTLARLREAAGHAPTASLLLLTARNRAGTLDDAFRLGVQAAFTSQMPASALGSLLGGISQGDLLLDTGHRTNSTGTPVKAEVPRLRVVGDQDARGTRTSA